MGIHALNFYAVGGQGSPVLEEVEKRVVGVRRHYNCQKSLANIESRDIPQSRNASILAPPIMKV